MQGKHMVAQPDSGYLMWFVCGRGFELRVYEHLGGPWYAYGHVIDGRAAKGPNPTGVLWAALPKAAYPELFRDANEAVTALVASAERETLKRVFP